MTDPQLVQPLMVSPTVARTGSTPASRHLKTWGRDDVFVEEVGLAVPVSHMRGVYHVDNLQLISNRDFQPGVVVFSSATMVSPPADPHPARENPHRDAVARRVARLAGLTKAAGDPFSQVSADRLVAFCDALAPDRKPAVFPLLNGNLRAVWENDVQEQIGIQFLPDGQLQHVLFRLEQGQLVETMGTELDEAGIRKLVDALGLRHLWFDGGR